ncbi:MAG: cation-translocating P-type ATPase [Gammaproteobacteria bacterium]
MTLFIDAFTGYVLAAAVLLIALLLVLVLFAIIELCSDCCSFLSRVAYRTSQPKSTSLEQAVRPIWHVMPVDQVAIELASNLTDGLMQSEAAVRLDRSGLNRLPEVRSKSAWLLFFSQFKSLLTVVLMAAAVLAAAIGEMKDGIVIMAVIVINAILGFHQEFQAEKSLTVLKKMLALRAEVRRDGQNQELSAELLVPGDIVVLKPGDKIPADGRIISANTVEVDESSLTGESIPVAKQNQTLENKDAPLAERSNMLYMNNAITRGRAEMIVTATGVNTEIGKLAGLLAQSDKTTTPLQRQLDSLGKRLALIAVAVIVVLFVSAVMRGEALIQTAFTSIALAVAAIPEGLPTVVTVTLALGMHRMARHHAIVKRLAAVETLGCTTVICTDKTGTLTLNQMTARSLFYKGQNYRVSGNGYQFTGEISPVIKHDTPDDMTRLLLPLAVCNDSHIRENQVLGDPLEAALIVLAAKGGIDQEEAGRRWPRIAEIPFDAAHKFMATFCRDGDEIKIFIKGAPEVLIDMCRFVINDAGLPSPIQPEPLLLQNTRMAETGLRVLGVAERTLKADGFSAENDLFRLLEEMTFIGLIGLMDPPRPEARRAIRLCHQAGIRIKMITGDQKVTAGAIADELGLSGSVMEGEQLSSLDDRRLLASIDDIGVFARTAPEQKVRIIQVLKSKGHIVAMTGDGVNDAPALKNADIGIAMGISGTHVAQEAATMVLTDDNFATIVNAVREGRGIYENMVKFVRFQLSTNIGAILTVAGAPLLALPVPFTAVQLLWINIIMDGPPAMSLGIDPCRKGSMSEPPRPIEAPILSWRRFGNLFSYGLTMAIGTLGILSYDLSQSSPEHAKTLAFTTFVLFQIFNVFNARSEKTSAFNAHFFANGMLWLSLFAVIFLQLMVIHWPPAQKIFHTTNLTRNDWLLAACAAGSILILEELRKLFHGMRRCKTSRIRT